MFRGLEQQFDIAAQMIDAGRSDLRSPFGFREDERTLQDRLGVECQALCRPFCTNSVKLHRLGNVGLQRRNVAADRGVARLAHPGMGSVYLLHYGGGDTAELRDFPLEKPLAEVEIAEDSIQGIAALVRPSPN